MSATTAAWSETLSASVEHATIASSGEASTQSKRTSGSAVE